MFEIEPEVKRKRGRPPKVKDEDAKPTVSLNSDEPATALANELGAGSDSAPSDMKAYKKAALREILSKLSKSHPDEGYHFRVKRKQLDGSWSYFGRCPGSVEDIEDYIATKYRDGHYRVFCHWANGKLVPEVPVIEMMVGNPNAAPTQSRAGVSPLTASAPDDGFVRTAKSERVREIEEEIEAKRKQKELIRVEKELEREHQRLYVDEEGDPISKKLEALEEAMMKFQEDAEDRTETLSHVRRLEAQIQQMRQEEREARIKAEYDRKLEEMKAELRRQQAPAKSGLGAAEYIQLAAAVSPIIQAYIENSQRSSERMISAVEKVGTMVTQSIPKGLDIEKIITLAPVVSKLIPRGPDMSVMFNMMGEIIPTLIEAAASGGGGGGGTSDEMSGMIKQVLATVQKAMESGRQAPSPQTFLPAQPMVAVPAAQPRGAVGRPVAPADPVVAQAAPPVAAKAAKPEPAKKRSAPRNEIPVVAMARAIEHAIRRRDERFEIYATGAQTTLAPSDIDRITSFESGEQLGNYLRSQPGVEGGSFSTTYGKSWLNNFLEALRPAEEEVYEEPPPPPEPKVTIEPPPAPKTRQTKATGEDPVVQKKKERFQSLQANPRAFRYPEDSDLDMMIEYGTPAGDLDLVVEAPSPEVIAARERERLEMVAKNTNPEICNIKYPNPAPIRLEAEEIGVDG